MEDMIHHGRAVVRARSMLCSFDMPFLSYHMGRYESVKTLEGLS